MRTNPLLDLCFSQPAGALKQPLFQEEGVHALEIEGQTDETPFACGRKQAAQGELAKAEDFFDDANDQLNRTFSQSINCLANLSLELVSHLNDAALPLCGWLRLLLEKGVPIEMMGFASGGDIRINSQILAIQNIRFREVTVI